LSRTRYPRERRIALIIAAVQAADLPLDSEIARRA
jgi:hypothetical protein